MSEVNPSGSQDPAGGNDPGKGTVSHDTFQKVLNEKKTMQAKLTEMENFKNQVEQRELETQGKYKELAEAHKKQADEFKSKNVELIKTVTNKNVKSQFKSLADKLGCVDSDLAYVACDFSDLQVSEDLDFDSSVLEGKIQGLAKAKPHLFKKDVQLPPNMTPGNGQSGAKTVDQMSTDELKKFI